MSGFLGQWANFKNRSRVSFVSLIIEKRSLVLFSIFILTVLFFTNARADQEYLPSEVTLIKELHREKFKKVFEKSCRDCHDSSLNIPWYGRFLTFINPVYSDVTEGRRDFDIQKMLSNPPEYSKRELRDIMRASIKLTRDDEMPPLLYKFVRPRMDPVDGFIISLAKREKLKVKSWAKNMLTLLREDKINLSGPIEVQVKYVFKENCMECHNPKSKKDNGNFTRIMDLRYVKENYIDHPDPTKTKLYKQVELKLNSQERLSAEMPHKRDPLKSNEIQIIHNWIRSELAKNTQ